MNIRVPLPLTWHICWIIIDSLGPIVHVCILNYFVISMSLKSSDEIDSMSFDNFKEEDGNVVYELSCLESNIKNKSFRFWIFFLSFLKNMKKKRPIICFL
jgi:hypothetical protein